WLAQASDTTHQLISLPPITRNSIPPSADAHPLSLRDALPIYVPAFATDSLGRLTVPEPAALSALAFAGVMLVRRRRNAGVEAARSEEHTSELQSRENLVCRLLLEKNSAFQRV